VRKKKFKTPWTPEKIKRIRTKNKISQIQLAKLIPCPQQRISEWELGIHSPGPSNSARLSEIHGLLHAFRQKAHRKRNMFMNLVRKNLGIDLRKKKRRTKAEMAVCN
jgi:transcriptional regulator with XRE-family HTH domain